MNGELQELMQSNPEWYKDLQYQDVKIYIKDNINSASRSFVAIGYYLKYIRNNELFSEDGYSSIWEFAQGEFGISKSQASKFMSINDKFSVHGNSPILIEQYRDFSSSKLSEMLYLTDEQLESVTVGMTKAEIRDIGKKDKVVSPAKQESKEPITIDDLDFTNRTYDCLNNAGINTIEELCELSRNDVIKIRNISHRCLDEIYMKLSGIGRCLKEEPLGNCIHRPEFPCTIAGASIIARADGESCPAKCCWNCPELAQCGYRCNASVHRPEEPEAIEITEDEFIIGFYQNCMYDHEKSIVSKRDTEMLRLELIKNHGKSYHGGSHVTDKGGTFASYPDKIVFRKPGDYEAQLQLKWGSYVSKLFKLLDVDIESEDEPDLVEAEQKESDWKEKVILDLVSRLTSIQQIDQSNGRPCEAYGKIYNAYSNIHDKYMTFQNSHGQLAFTIRKDHIKEEFERFEAESLSGEMEEAETVEADIIQSEPENHNNYAALKSLTEFINSLGDSQYNQIKKVITETCAYEKAEVSAELIDRITNRVSIWLIGVGSGYRKYLRQKSQGGAE